MLIGFGDWKWGGAATLGRGEGRAFLLTALHEAQAAEGVLRRESLVRIADRFEIPLAELVGFAEFFHYLNVEGQRHSAAGGCHGPVCSLSSDPEAIPPLHGSGIACPGLCDQRPAMLGLDGFAESGRLGGVFAPAHEVPFPEVLLKYGRVPNSERLSAYRELGGYGQLERLLLTGDAEAALESIERGGLRGRGGAAYPFARKLKAVREQDGPVKFVVCNADEGEPATFKDRVILHRQPHLLLEALAISAVLVGAADVIIYLRYEYPEALSILRNAVEELRASGLLDRLAQVSTISLSIEVVRGAGSYVCGEETALLNSLEGKIPWPAERPPFPTEKGLFGRPTLVGNVETLSCIPPLLAMGPDAFRACGRAGNGGTKIYSLSGQVCRPGNYELPLGVSARELIFEFGGGVPYGRRLKGFTLGGVSGGLLGPELLDLALDFDAPQKEGYSLGSGGVVVLDETNCVVDFVRSCLRFYEEESCGRCFPCRIGNVRLREFFDALTGRSDMTVGAFDEAAEIQEVMSTASACGLGRSAPLLMRGLLRSFQEEVWEHLRDRHCRSGVCQFLRSTDEFDVSNRRQAR